MVVATIIYNFVQIVNIFGKKTKNSASMKKTFSNHETFEKVF